MVGRLLEQALAYHTSFSSEIAQDIMEQSPSTRGYLALWIWLRSPGQYSFEHVLHLLGQINLSEVLSSPNPVDKQVLHHLITWISLFDLNSILPPSIVSSLKDGLKEFDPVFDLENKILWALRLWKSGDKLELTVAIKKIKEHPLYVKSPYLLSEFAGRLFEEPQDQSGLFYLTANNIRKLFSPSGDQRESLVINLDTGCLFPPRQADMLVSAEICKVMQTLYLRRSISFAEVLSTAFMFNFYDSFTHRQKVFNFISKIKTILPPNLKLKTKGETLFTSGSWTNIHFENNENLPAILKISPVWKKIKNVKYSKQINSQELIHPKKFTINQFQNLTGQTRSSAHRRLKKLLETKKVTKVGAGKNTYYVSQSSEILTWVEDEK